MELKFEPRIFFTIKDEDRRVDRKQGEGIFLKRTGNRIEGKGRRKVLSSSDWPERVYPPKLEEDENMGIGR